MKYIYLRRQFFFSLFFAEAQLKPAHVEVNVPNLVWPIVSNCPV